MAIQASIITQQHTHQLLDQFPSDRLPEISLFLEQLLKIVNTNVVNQPSPSHPWLKFAGMYGDDFDWETFQAGIDEYRCEVDTKEKIL